MPIKLAKVNNISGLHPGLIINNLSFYESSYHLSIRLAGSCRAIFGEVRISGKDPENSADLGKLTKSNTLLGDVSLLSGDISNIWGLVSDAPLVVDGTKRNAPLGITGNLRGNVTNLTGDVTYICGDATGIWGTIKYDADKLSGDVTKLTGDISGIFGVISPNLMGDVSKLIGDITGLEGNVTNLSGNVTFLNGNATKVKGTVSGLKGSLTKLTGNVSKITGDIQTPNDGSLPITREITGDVTNVGGVITTLKGSVSNIRGTINLLSGDATKISGYISNITGTINNGVTNFLFGDVSGLVGNITNLFGDATNIIGNITNAIEASGPALDGAGGDGILSAPTDISILSSGIDFDNDGTPGIDSMPAITFTATPAAAGYFDISVDAYSSGSFEVAVLVDGAQTGTVFGPKLTAPDKWTGKASYSRLGIPAAAGSRNIQLRVTDTLGTRTTITTVAQTITIL